MPKIQKKNFISFGSSVGHGNRNPSRCFKQRGLNTVNWLHKVLERLEMQKEGDAVIHRYVTTWSHFKVESGSKEETLSPEPTLSVGRFARAPADAVGTLGPRQSLPCRKPGAQEPAVTSHHSFLWNQIQGCWSAYCCCHLWNHAFRAGSVEPTHTYCCCYCLGHCQKQKRQRKVADPFLPPHSSFQQLPLTGITCSHLARVSGK